MSVRPHQPSAVQSGDTQVVPYQPVLRAIGAELDALRASQVMVLESPDGFLVRFLRPETGQALHLLHFTYDRLGGLQLAMAGKRTRRLSLRVGRNRMPGRYQDVLRAVGYELERLQAYVLLLDECEDSFHLSYQSLHPQAGYLPQKRMVVLDPAHQQDLLETARGRRRR